MQSRNPLLDDLAKVTTGALSTLTTLKSELEALARQQMERLLAQMDLVPRDEFEAVKAMAAKARTEQERLEKRLNELETRLSAASKTRAKAGADRKSRNQD